MNWFTDLFFSGGVAHSILIISIVVAAGMALSGIKIKGISLGITWILFVGIALSHFGMRLDGEIIHLFKEFGLILFVYSIGMQVGPGFVASFKKGGITLNMLAMSIVFLGCITTYIIHLFTDIPIPTMVGIMSGAVTNTPGLGAAQQANMDITGVNDPNIATGYAVAYPLAVVGIIGTVVALRYILGINMKKEAQGNGTESMISKPVKVTLCVTNPAANGLQVKNMQSLIQRNYVISRIQSKDGDVKIVDGETELHLGDKMLFITSQDAVESITCFIGEEVEMNWREINTQYISRRIIITKKDVNGKSLAQLRLRSFGVSVTTVNRASINLVASPHLQLQIGDKVTVVGREQSIIEVEKKLGNSLVRLDHPNLLPVFFGIALGVIFGSIPFMFPGIPQPVKLGLAGGPLIVAIIVSRIGYKYKLITYMTASANLMIREVGIALFLACVGLGAGETFVETIVSGGYKWVGYGVLITLIPILIVGIVGRKIYKINYFTLSGLISGSMTDPPALAYSNEMAGNDSPAVAYATVYPFTMFLRVLCAQLMILLLS